MSIFSRYAPAYASYLSPLEPWVHAIADHVTRDYKAFVLAFMWVAFVWETYLSLRQHRNLYKSTLHPSLSSVISPTELIKSNAYGKDKSWFGLLTSIVGQVQTTLVFVYNLLPWFWALAGNVMTEYLPDWSRGEITQSILFFIITSLVSSTIDIPFQLYRTFVIEAKHGFNKQTLGLFFSDFLKGLLVAGILGVPFLAAFLKIIEVTGDNFFYYVWIFMLAFQFIMITIYPTLIQPLFNTFTPLGEGSLKTKIETLATKVSFPLTKVFVIDGSRRSSHSNAYFYGFFKNKRIVLFDTLIEQTNEEEICGVLAHELGHWAHNHVFRTLLVTQVHLFALFYLFSLFIHSSQLYSDFSFSTTQPILIGFLLFQYIYAPMEAIMSFFMNLLSRHHEFQADRYAKNLGYAKVLASGLIKLQVKNLGNMNPDWLYSMWHYSHPPLVERLDAIGIKNE